jgi:parvulin-like peptidyl-prolyl isomerase
MQVGQFDEALQCMDKAISLRENDFDAHFKKGQVLILQKKYEEAATCFNKALEISPNFSPAAQGLDMVEDIIDKKKQGYIRVRQILVATIAEAQRIKGEIDKGENFLMLAGRYSIDPSGKTGGNLGFVKKGELLKIIEDAIFALDVGEVSDIVRTGRGYHIFMRVE